jgi:acyl dehydratase
MDLVVGQAAEREMTVTPETVRSYAQLTGDVNPLHFDEAFARATRFGRLIAQGGIATGLLHALVAMDLPGPGSVFLSQEWTFPKPVYIGDTIQARATVLSVNERRGIARLKVEVMTQTGAVALRGEASVMQLEPGGSA